MILGAFENLYDQLSNVIKSLPLSLTDKVKYTEPQYRLDTGPRYNMWCRAIGKVEISCQNTRPVQIATSRNSGVFSNVYYMELTHCTVKRFFTFLS